MGNAVPKQTHRTPKDQREDNPYKSQFTKTKPAPRGLTQGKPKPERPLNCFKTYVEDKPKKPLQRRTRLGVGKGSLRNGKPALRRPSAKQGQRFMVSQSGSTWSTKKRKPLRLQSLSENARERRRLDRQWVEAIWAIWGACILTGAVQGGYWSVDAHHAYDKSYRPEWRHARHNGILLRRDVHNLADDDPDFHKALCEIADECRAAAGTDEEPPKRPPLTRSEARTIIFRVAPHMRKYAAPETED